MTNPTPLYFRQNFSGDYYCADWRLTPNPANRSLFTLTYKGREVATSLPLEAGRDLAAALQREYDRHGAPADYSVADLRVALHLNGCVVKGRTTGSTTERSGYRCYSVALDDGRYIYASAEHFELLPDEPQPAPADYTALINDLTCRYEEVTLAGPSAEEISFARGRRSGLGEALNAVRQAQRDAGLGAALNAVRQAQRDARC